MLSSLPKPLPSLPFHHLKFNNKSFRFQQQSFTLCCSSDDESPQDSVTPTTTTTTVPPLVKKRTRYRKLYPGESQGIVEEMRFVAMKLRNSKTPQTPTPTKKNITESGVGELSIQDPSSSSEEEEPTWKPSTEGFLKYLIDNHLVFQTLERLVDESDDVSYAYFRKTGLERSEALSKDLEWFREQDLPIPEPSDPGVSYAGYLEELAVKNAPMFLCHFYNIYFSHISAGQVITKQVSNRLFEGKKLEFCRWEQNELELLQDARKKLNKLGEHWSRDDKNKCLREASKSFRFMGQIVRLIIL